jgi:hypothetical protein
MTTEGDKRQFSLIWLLGLMTALAISLGSLRAGFAHREPLLAIFGMIATGSFGGGTVGLFVGGRDGALIGLPFGFAIGFASTTWVAGQFVP